MLNALWQSARYRASSLIWVVLSLALALGLVMLVERLRDGVRDGFSQSVANIDLVVGAPAGDVQLLLHSVFNWARQRNRYRSPVWNKHSLNLALNGGFRSR